MFKGYQFHVSGKLLLCTIHLLSVVVMLWALCKGPWMRKLARHHHHSEQ